MPRKLRSGKRRAQTPSPFMRYLLGVGAQPPGRCRGWVDFMTTAGPDSRPLEELVEKYGDAIRRECLAAGFEPDFDVEIGSQSAGAQVAAARWAAAVYREGAY